VGEIFEDGSQGSVVPAAVRREPLQKFNLASATGRARSKLSVGAVVPILVDGGVPAGFVLMGLFGINSGASRCSLAHVGYYP
jgi:hypothetical protein